AHAPERRWTTSPCAALSATDQSLRSSALRLTKAVCLAVAVVAPPPVARRDVVVFVLASPSKFEVKTGKAGLLGFAGHEHVIRARAFSGRIEYHADAPADSRVEVVVPTDSLEVLTPPDTEEIRKVTATMR